MEDWAALRLSCSISPPSFLQPKIPKRRQIRPIKFCVLAAAPSCTVSSALSRRTPGAAVTDCSSPGGDGFYGNGGNGRNPFFVDGGEEENPRKQLPSIAGRRFAEMTKSVKEEEEEEEGAYTTSRWEYLAGVYPSRWDYLSMDTYTTIMIGSCCALIRELCKMGKGSLASMVCNVSLLASFALSSHSLSSGGDIGGRRHAFASLSSSAIGAAWLVSHLLPYKQKIFDYLFQATMDNMFKAARSACENSVKRIIGTRTSKGIMLGCAFCIVGQGAANLITSAKVPPNVIMTAALCGGLLFLVVKEICSELNEASPVTEKLPLVAISEMISPAAKAKWFPPVTLNFTADWQSSYHDAMEYDYLSAHGARYRKTESSHSNLRIGLSVSIPVGLLGLW